MNNKNDFDARVAEAWKAHYAGQQDVAIQKFIQVVAEAPDAIDARWGLGLSYRKAGERDSALEVFQQVDALLAKALEQETENQERFFMLKRMVKQQIEQMSDFI